MSHESTEQNRPRADNPICPLAWVSAAIAAARAHLEAPPATAAGEAGGDPVSPGDEAAA